MESLLRQRREELETIAALSTDERTAAINMRFVILDAEADILEWCLSHPSDAVMLKKIAVDAQAGILNWVLSVKVGGGEEGEGEGTRGKNEG